MSVSALGTFLTKFKDWKYCPPSNHLWTVTFLLSSQGDISGNSFSTLYDNIIKVNNSFDSMYSPRWKVSTPNNAKNFVINAQDGDIGLFLANEIQFNTNSIEVQDSQSGTNQQFTGWIEYGKTQTGRSLTHDIKIIFNKTNWDITEIFFDRWIAAIGQQGLIEDSSLYNIKANIIIREYACSAPNTPTTSWVPRKQIKLIRAFPKSRGQNNYNYEEADAGAMKNETVEFAFDSYQIEYFNIASEKTPGYITGTTAVGTSKTGRTYTDADIDRKYSNTK